ncbi:hypothetical protein LTR37_008092 [Vermiconidia calcicola]|uniref:Uncharacterized protein n=1 Tax=Vermiconidia calcicola TaxID=1690605 RepID=A0ACC3NCA9_9PEZI|nr:hypothetical protein LTR37_008092 [Vermiconidia calcicola]
MAATSSRAHLFSQLSARRATSSPGEEHYTTASSNSFDPAAEAIHSTMQIPDNTTQQQLPHQQHFRYDQFQDGSAGSADMSIELGRGVKRGARDIQDDVSSNHVFNLGNDSFYELTGTPPIRSRSGQKKQDDTLRRQASIRRATEATKSNDAAKRGTSSKHRSFSEALRNITADDDTSFVAEDAQQTATFNARNTRFSRSRQTSAVEPSNVSRFASGPRQQQTPRKASNNNPTVQSNSFVLPDLPNLTELVSGVRKDGTPVFYRTAKPRSRFTSGTHKSASRQEYLPIESVPVPDEEKAIYASLQLLKERVEQLEQEKSEAAKRAEEYEGDIIDLRSQLAMAQRRPDSGLGSSDEYGSGTEKLRAEKKKLQASVKALQDRLDRSERKISVSEIQVKRVTKERDELVTQIGVAYYNNEELKAEIETFQDQHGRLVAKNSELKDDVDALRKENQDLRLLMAQTQRSYEEETQQRQRKDAETKNKLERRARAARETKVSTRDLLQGEQVNSDNPEAQRAAHRSQIESDKGDMRRLSLGFLDDVTSDDIAVRIAQEVKKNREEAVATLRTQSARQNRISGQNQTGMDAHSRATSGRVQQLPVTTTHHPTAAPKRNFSAPVEDADASDADSTTQLDFTQRSRTNPKRASLPTAAHPSGRTAAMREEDNRDLTLLSFQDPIELNNLRKKLEEERRSGRLGGRAASAPVGTQHMSHVMPRKSSLKDVTAGFEAGTGRFNIDEWAKTAKSVRLQSPHTSDESVHAHQPAEVGDISISSNTSRRRRRAASAEGMTSAFIVPDITIHGKDGQLNAHHDKTNCTACPSSNENVTIPAPIPVTDRPEDVADVTNATIRPSQPPKVALGTVIKQLEDEIAHLKIKLAAQHRLYNQHNPALSKRRRLDVRATMDKLTVEIERRSDQVYALYDVVEGQKEAAAAAGEQTKDIDENAVEETLESLGINPVELSGFVGRKAALPLGLDGADDMSDQELPWEGLSDAGSEEDLERQERRRSGLF